VKILDFANILEDFTETSYEEWQVKRRAQIGIGGSDAGTLMGQNSFKDEYSLYLEKIGELEPSEAGEAAEWGHTLEPVVAAKWHERHGKALGLEIEEFPYLLQNKEHPFMLANMDRLIRKDDDFGILEVKTASEYLNGEWENGEILSDGRGGGKVPPKYYSQLQHYFAVTGLSWGYFCALVGGNKLYSVYVERNEEYIRHLIETEALFMQRLEMRIPPDLNGSDSCKNLVGKMYQQKSENFNEIEDTDFGEWLLERIELKNQIDELTKTHKEMIGPMEERLNLLENQLKVKIGTDKGVIWSGWKVTWNERAGRKSVDMKLLEEKYPDIATEVIKQGESYRQLSVAKPKTKGKSA
jgi:putative phage-type endonuclease